MDQTIHNSLIEVGEQLVIVICFSRRSPVSYKTFHIFMLHTFYYKNFFIRIIRLKSENNKNYLRIILRLRSCSCQFKSYLNLVFSYVKINNYLRIFWGWKREILRITLRLAWKILILIKKTQTCKQEYCSAAWLWVT